MIKRSLLPITLLLALTSPTSNAAPLFPAPSQPAEEAAPLIRISSPPTCPQASEAAPATRSNFLALFEALNSSPQPILQVESLSPHQKAMVTKLALALEVSPGQILGGANDTFAAMEIKPPHSDPLTEQRLAEFEGRTRQFLISSKRASDALLAAEKAAPNDLRQRFAAARRVFDQGPITDAKPEIARLLDQAQALPADSTAWLTAAQAALSATAYDWTSAAQSYSDAAELIAPYDGTAAARIYGWSVESMMGNDDLEQALMLTERGLSFDSTEAERLNLLSWKAVLLDDTAGRQTAYPVFAEALTGLKRLGYQLREAGRWAEAEKQYQKLLYLSTIYFGPDHKQIGGALNELAIALFMQGKFSDVLPLMEQSIDSASRHYGPDHPETQGIKQNLAHMRRCIEQSPH